MKTTPQSIPALQRLCGQSRKSGPSGETQTLGLVVPNHAFYQLNYTRIFNFCHDTTAKGKNKVFSVCGHSCGQNRFCVIFGNQGKSRKRRCRKALRRFALPCPGYRHGTPKCRALPVEPHPDIHFSAMIPRRTVKIKFFLSVVIYVVKADFIPLSAIVESPANAGVARLCGVSPHPIPDTTTALPKFPSDKRFEL